MSGKATVGILAYGSYLPATRLPLAMIHGGDARAGGPEKAVAAFDEDVITMAVAAGAECLRTTARESLTGLYLASTSSPFREKQSAAFVARALDLPGAITTHDFSGSLRCAAGALQAAVDAVSARPGSLILVIAAEARLPAPRSPLEANLGDGAAAFLVGSGAPLAVLQASCAIADEIYDVWRAEHDDYLRSWEDRFNIIHGYNESMTTACRRLFEQTATGAGDYSRAVLYGPDARSHAALAKQLGFGREQVQDALFGRVGNCGAAFTPLLLAASLEQSKPGDRLLVGFYGDGAELMSLEVRGNDFRPARGIDWHLDRGRPVKSYDSYLKSRHLDAGEHDRRAGDGVPATVHYRERSDDISFHGQRCTLCNTVHFPACRVCYVCHAKDSFEPVRLSDKHGRVMSYSFDYFFPSPEPPVIVGVCEVENGARVYVQMCDAEPEQLRCDLPVEFVLRKIHDAGNRPNYFWKSRPLVGSEGGEGAA